MRIIIQIMIRISALDDARLVQLVSQGDRQAIINLCDRHSPSVYSLAIRIIGKRMVAEEVTQDTSLKLWTRVRSFSPKIGGLLTWLLTITSRTAPDRIRFEKRKPEFGNPADPEDAWLFSSDPNSQTEETRRCNTYF